MPRGWVARDTWLLKTLSKARPIWTLLLLHIFSSTGESCLFFVFFLADKCIACQHSVLFLLNGLSFGSLTYRNGLSTQTKQISFLETLPDDAQISREERAFRFWINSLGNSEYINNVFEDLRNGYIMVVFVAFYSHRTSLEISSINQIPFNHVSNTVSCFPCLKEEFQYFNFLSNFEGYI